LSTTDVSSTTTAPVSLSDLRSVDGLSALTSGDTFTTTRDASAPLVRFVRLDELPSGVSPLAP
jgi:hypothetical protein